ncbi:MAG: DNA-processing protein DprA, partial [Longimicrobiales bacterium]|nr:DNA-processing protein DprA [Longimicrobiales bacterium]
MDAVTPGVDPTLVARLVPLLRLASVPGLGRARAARWFVEEGGVAGALERARREIDARPVLDPGAAATRAEAVLAACAAHHTRPVFPEDDAYPEPFRHLPDPPLVVYMRGRGIGADEVAVAVVGSRRATAYGRRVARELGRALGEAGVTVVSGLA